MHRAHVVHLCLSARPGSRQIHQTVTWGLVVAGPENACGTRPATLQRLHRHRGPEITAPGTTQTWDFPSRKRAFTTAFRVRLSCFDLRAKQIVLVLQGVCMDDFSHERKCTLHSKDNCILQQRRIKSPESTKKIKRRDGSLSQLCVSPTKAASRKERHLSYARAISNKP